MAVLNLHHLTGLGLGKLLFRERSTVTRRLQRARAAFLVHLAKNEGPIPMVRTGGRPRRDMEAIERAAMRVLARLLEAEGLPSPFVEPTTVYTSARQPLPYGGPGKKPRASRRQTRADERRAEERAWAARSGPIRTTRLTKEALDALFEGN
jgi:hypothetical protein